MTATMQVRESVHLRIWAEEGMRPSSSLLEVARSPEYGLWKAQAIREDDGSLTFRLPYTEEKLGSFEKFLEGLKFLRVDPSSKFIKGPRYAVG